MVLCGHSSTSTVTHFAASDCLKQCQALLGDCEMAYYVANLRGGSLGGPNTNCAITSLGGRIQDGFNFYDSQEMYLDTPLRISSNPEPGQKFWVPWRPRGGLDGGIFTGLKTLGGFRMAVFIAEPNALHTMRSLCRMTT